MLLEQLDQATARTPATISNLAVNDGLVGDAAAELLDMRARRRLVPDLPFALRPETLSGTYAIQHRVVAGLVAQGGGRCIGYKVACTNEIARLPRCRSIDRCSAG